MPERVIPPVDPGTRLLLPIPEVVAKLMFPLKLAAVALLLTKAANEFACPTPDLPKPLSVSGSAPTT